VRIFSERLSNSLSNKGFERVDANYCGHNSSNFDYWNYLLNLGFLKTEPLFFRNPLFLLGGSCLLNEEELELNDEEEPLLEELELEKNPDELELDDTEWLLDDKDEPLLLSGLEEHFVKLSLDERKNISTSSLLKSDDT
jgi:hypothetical protein